VRLASLLKDGGCDLVARAAMRDPHFALSAAEQLGEVAPWPPQLERARRVRPPREPR
jgi:2,4-dienoyl-CoA reductase-like NADH-dependent reductase (Old Yellow Enzyme family)